MDIKKIVEMLKPIAIVLIAVLGLAQESIFDKDVSFPLFLAIIIVSFLLRGGAIIKGFSSLRTGGTVPPDDDEGNG